MMERKKETAARLGRITLALGRWVMTSGFVLTLLFSPVSALVADEQKTIHEAPAVPVMLVFVRSGHPLLDLDGSRARQILQTRIEASLKPKEIEISSVFSVEPDRLEEGTREQLKKLDTEAALVIAVHLTGDVRRDQSRTMFQGVAELAAELMTYRFEHNRLNETELSLALNKQITPLARWSDDDEEHWKYLGLVAEKMDRNWPEATPELYAGRLLDLKQEMDLTYGDDIPGLLEKTPAAPKDLTRWLVVIGIENYRFTDHIDYARRSAELFTAVAQRKLGIDDSRVRSMIDEEATAGAIETQIRWLTENVKNGDTIYFYYNGHGIPNKDEDNEPYILPQDSSPKMITQKKFFRLKDFYTMLTNTPASKVVAFVDSCFSGATDDKTLFPGAAAARLAPKKVTFDTERMAVLTAGTGTQFSNRYSQRKHRLFTYYLMQSLLEGQKEIDGIYRRVSVKVEDVSLKLGDIYRQQPTLEGNKKISL
jgi:hypothetical protein